MFVFFSHCVNLSFHFRFYVAISQFFYRRHVLCCKNKMVFYMSNNKFDVDKFYSALDLTRINRNLTWRSLANQAEVSASTLTRMGQGNRPDVDGLVSLASWAKLDLKDFYVSSLSKESERETLVEISALLRADSKLDGESAQMLEEMLRPAYEHLKNRLGKT